MKILSSLILSGVLLIATSAFAQDESAPAPEKGKPAVSEVQKGGFNGPAFHRGWEQQGPRGPMNRGQFRGGPRGPQRPQMSPNDRPEEWEQTLAARRSEMRHNLNPNGPYPRQMMGPWMQRGPRGPMWAQGGPRGPQKECCCQCHKQHGKKNGKQFRHGQRH